jgi:hypothetical protein
MQRNYVNRPGGCRNGFLSRGRATRRLFTSVNGIPQSLRHSRKVRPPFAAHNPRLQQRTAPLFRIDTNNENCLPERVRALPKVQFGPSPSLASSGSGSDECRCGLIPATLMRRVKSQ